MRIMAKKHLITALLLACYAGGLVVFLAAHLVGFVQNRVAYANGQLAPGQLSVQDFALQDVEVQPDGTLLTLGGDPQMLLLDTGRRVENVRIDFTYARPPLLENVFWKTPNQEYSTRRMAYPNAAGQHCLPAAGGQGLRIDPGTQISNIITVNSIVVNQKRPLWQFFTPTAGEVFLLLVLPGLLAAGLSITRNSGLWRRKKPNRKVGEARG